jgi:hypothetical protein
MEKKIEIENEQLKTKYEKLKKENDELEVKYKKLQNDYSENIIIQSMNDMKRRYDELVTNSVSKYKYESVVKRSNNYYKKICTTVVLLNHIMKRIKLLEQHTFDSGEIDLYRIDFEILTIIEILEDDMII